MPQDIDQQTEKHITETISKPGQNSLVIHSTFLTPSFIGSLYCTFCNKVHKCTQLVHKSSSCIQEWIFLFVKDINYLYSQMDQNTVASLTKIRGFNALSTPRNHPRKICEILLQAKYTRCRAMCQIPLKKMLNRFMLETETTTWISLYPLN
jgi:hypothetical protein